ncbi:unnamed protein product [Dibothriocephalus latus]|uniref:Uncharacterized protein n=1 Tax=Dibothriocephalus latus TaxID=60516 RepID=A0A3P6R2H3_DIBLA|nr:unnamed protein product [Dibothriocephalus latus]
MPALNFLPLMVASPLRLPAVQSDSGGSPVQGLREKLCNMAADDASAAATVATADSLKFHLIASQWHRQAQRTTDFLSFHTTSLRTPSLPLLLPEFLTAIGQHIS